MGLVVAGYISPFFMHALQLKKRGIHRKEGILVRLFKKYQDNEPKKRESSSLPTNLSHTRHLPAVFPPLKAMSVERPDIVHVLTSSY